MSFLRSSEDAAAAAALDDCYYSDGKLIMQPFWIQLVSFPCMILFVTMLNSIIRTVRTKQFTIDTTMLPGIAAFMIAFLQFANLCVVAHSFVREVGTPMTSKWAGYQQLYLECYNSGVWSSILVFVLAEEGEDKKKQSLESLDELASTFVQNGFDLKEMERHYEEEKLKKPPKTTREKFRSIIKVLYRTVVVLMLVFLIPAAVTHVIPAVALYFWIFVGLVLVHNTLTCITKIKKNKEEETVTTKRMLSKYFHFKLLVWMASLAIPVFFNYAFLFYDKYEYIHVLTFDWSKRSLGCYFKWVEHEWKGTRNFVAWIF